MRSLTFVERGFGARLATLLERWIVVAGISAGISVSGQSSIPGFEVTSIKPHAPNSGFHEPGCSNDRFTSIGLPLQMVIGWAYELGVDANREFRGANRSLMEKSYRYDIQAKAERPVTESQCRLMVQALLADGFKLAVHWESKEAQVWDLVVAPGGPKMQQARETDVGTDRNIITNGRPLSTGPRDPAAEPDPKGFTMKELADLLTYRRNFEPIVDKTGLEGRYKIDLRYSTGLPSDAFRSAFGGRLGPPASSDADQAVDPELEAALPKQLGLRLEKHKGSVKILVLDHIEPPTAN
jgi:uncharacterized protein (TIGR03435 family)